MRSPVAQITKGNEVILGIVTEADFSIAYNEPEGHVATHRIDSATHRAAEPFHARFDKTADSV
jgi:hypothetical protein